MESKQKFARPGRPALPTVTIAALLLTVVAGGGFGQECTAPPELRDTWSLSSRDLETLANSPGEPLLVEKEVSDPPDGADGELEIRAHMHALFEQEFQYFTAAIRSLEEQAEFLPRLEVSDVLCSEGEPVSYARIRQELVFSFLFFNRSYEYVLHYNFEDPKGEDGSLRVWWELAERRDDQILTTDGSFYFEEVLREGEAYTYVAYGTHTIFEEERLGLRAALERFGERNVRNAILALAEEAERRE